MKHTPFSGKQLFRTALAALLATLNLLSASPAFALAQEAEAPLPQLRISEVMSSNKSTLALPDGSFPDWLELYNAGDTAADLGGGTLLCGGDRWTLPDLRLEPGAYLTVYCDKGETRGTELHASFFLSAEGERLALLSAAGETLDALVLPPLEDDTSWALDPEGGFSVSPLPSPGFSNGEDGYAAFQETRTAPAEDLAIGEVMVYNEWYLPQPVAGEYRFYAWVEVTNFSDRTLPLSDYYLSDRSKTPLRYRLPSQALAPGESRVILCDAGGDVAGAPFGLSSGGETLYLTRADGTLCDYVCLRDIPLRCSVGRLQDRGGFFYFSSPTPGEKNHGSARFPGKKPVSLTRDGVYEGVDSLRVDLAADGLIRYTLDGSLPTQDSTLYTGPITVRETCVLRAVNFEDKHLPSEALSLSFILNEGHTLPVVSLVCGEEDLFGADGIYSHPAQRWERPGCVMFYGEEGSFAIDCGLRLHGATSRTEQDKKSFKLCFRDRYDGRLCYDLFGNGVLDFQSILLRSAQEGNFPTLIRDSLMHRLAAEAFPALPVQDSRFAVLYLNGRYWGVYDIREAHSDLHYANHFGLEEDGVEQWEQLWPLGSLPAELFRFAQENDLSQEEAFAQVASHLDLNSMIAWVITEVYAGNFDLHSPNMRFYYTQADERLHYALVDLDFSMFRELSFDDLLEFGYEYTFLLMDLLENASFRKDFLTQLAAALEGPLSEEHVLSRLDALEAELSPEMARDYRRWNLPPGRWAYEIETMRAFLRRGGGRAAVLADVLRRSAYFPAEEVEAFFPAP